MNSHKQIEMNIGLLKLNNNQLKHVLFEHRVCFKKLVG